MILHVPLLFICLLHAGNCWTTEDLELFDLVESTPQTFYQVLGVDEKASASEIKKAYRKLSTLLHPDRNKSPNAEEEFRRVAAVSEVLRNEERRKTYDLVLKMGLPDWRAPIYYYRRVRNMGLFEMLIFLFCLATLAQYIFLWTAYYEKKYEIEEVVLSRVRKRAKHQRKGNSAQIEEEIVSEATSILQKPRWCDLFPVRLFDLIVDMVKSSPSFLVSCKEYLTRPKEETIEEESDEEPHVPRIKRRPVKPRIPEYSGVITSENVSNGVPAYQEEHTNHTENNNDNWDVDNLTEDQIAEFKKALKKFPNGTLQRWEKIAAHLHCTVPQVVLMVKQMKTNQYAKGVPISMQGVTGTEKENFGHKLYEAKDAKTQGSGTNENGVLHHGSAHENVEKIWKQEEQQAFEIALQKFSKDTTARWDRIAEFVGTKSKEECVERYKNIVQQIKKKKGL